MFLIKLYFKPTISVSHKVQLLIDEKYKNQEGTRFL